MAEEVPSDARFVLRLFRLMSECRTDYTGIWRALLDVSALSSTHEAQQLSGTQSQSGADVTENVEIRGAGPASVDSSEEGITGGDDEETLRPLRAILNAAGASSTQLEEWAIWLREYSSRIGAQGIGKSHADGEEEGRAARLEVMRNGNPDFVLRATNLEKALRAAEKGGERSYLLFSDLSRVLADAQLFHGGRLSNLK